ncbi:MAG: FapA family protein [Treponema sp.]|nr:FapA family protein [Treponema sp.]
MAYGAETEYDGKIILNFFPNNLEVRGDFYPHEPGGIPIDDDYIRDLLYRANIVHGIQHEQIHAAYEACTVHGDTVRDVLIAKGDPPVNEVPEHLQFNPALNQAKLPDDEDAVVDHKERSSFIIIKKGQALAKLRPLRIGVNGTNIFGGDIEFKVAKPQEVFQGENTHMEGSFLLASVSGQLVQTKGALHVREALHIKGSVGYGTGNIVFPGSVQIDGTVSDGFKIFCGDTLTVKQTFDVSEVVTKNDLNVAGGIIGRAQAMLKVGGLIRTKFIENCRVAGRMDVKVELEILNSNIYTMGLLEMGEKGRIVGSEIYAFKGVRAGSIGKATGKAARIHCGIDFAMEQEKERHNRVLYAISSKMKQINTLLEDPATSTKKREQLEVHFKKLEEEQTKTQEKITEIIGKLENFEAATIEVRGEIIPGTLIEICQTALFVTTPLKKVRIRLDSSQGKLIIDNL